MTDRTTQPATQVGVNPVFAANARFLWNAAVPNKNSLNNGDSGTGLRGTDNTGTAGKYRTFGVDGQMSFPVTMPSGAYTLVVVHAFPVASRGSAQTVSTASGTGFQCVPYTTGGGVYENYTHRGVADSGQNLITGVGSFNTAPWVEVFAFTGSGGSPANQLRRYRRSGLGVDTQGTETLAYVNPSTNIFLGDGGGATTQGLYAVLLVAGDVGATECEALRANPWRMFAPEITAPELTGSIALDAIEPGGTLGLNPSGLAGSITLDAVAPTGTLGIAPGSVTTFPFSRNTGSRPTGLTGVAVAILSDDANMTRLAGATSINQDGAGRITYTGAGLPSVGTSVLVVTREPDGKLGLERYTVA